ncbi:MAG TPA: caspase family protein, partial [Polyangiaceae bacterium]|nr:caspase family protein [Polyangiaceae bacterium]
MRLRLGAPWLVTSVLTLTGLVTVTAPRPAHAEVARFALVIGNNQAPAGSTSTLRYADDDAVAMHRLLVQAGVESRLLVRLDRDSRRLHGPIEATGTPRAADLERASLELTSAIARAKERGHSSELLIFYSGHGDIDGGEGFVMLEDQRLTRRRLFELLKASKATRNHVFVDACRSYFLVFDRGPGGQRRRYSGAPPEEGVPAQLANTGFVLSTSSDRESHEWERFQGGILSHELRSALRGAADTNLDGRIDYGELGAFLTIANRSIENPRFRPSFTVRAPAGNLQQSVLSWRGTAPLSSSRNDLGHFYVETARGERILDAHPARGQVLRLWPPR